MCVVHSTLMTCDRRVCTAIVSHTVYNLQVENWREEKIKSQKNTVFILLLLLLLLLPLAFPPFANPAAAVFCAPSSLWIINIKNWWLIIFLHFPSSYFNIHLFDCLLLFCFNSICWWHNLVIAPFAMQKAFQLVVTYPFDFLFYVRQVNEHRALQRAKKRSLCDVRVSRPCPCVCRSTFALILIVSQFFLGAVFGLLMLICFILYFSCFRNKQNIKPLFNSSSKWES